MEIVIKLVFALLIGIFTCAIVGIDPFERASRKFPRLGRVLDLGCKLLVITSILGFFFCMFWARNNR